MLKLRKLGKKNVSNIPPVLIKKYHKIRNYREYLVLIKKKLSTELYIKLCSVCEGTYQNDIAPMELFAFLFPKHKNVCATCGTETKWDAGLRVYREHCSKRCMNSDPTTVTKREATCLARHGVKNIFEDTERIKASYRETLGVDNPSKCEEIKQRKRDTSLENCGETHWSKTNKGRKQFSKQNPMKNEVHKKSCQDSCLESTGYSNPLLSPEIQQRIKETNLREYGVDNHFKHPEFTVKRKASCMERYGVDHQMKHPSTLKKIRKTRLTRYGTENMQQVDGYSWKTHIATDGKTHNIQGYEGICIDWILENLKELKRVKSLVKRQGIRYMLLGKSLRYYPDLLVQRTNKKSIVVEVKSKYTLLYELGKNYFKFVAAEEYYKQHGKLFWLWVKDGKKIKLIKHPSQYVAMLLESHNP